MNALNGYSEYLKNAELNCVNKDTETMKIKIERLAADCLVLELKDRDVHIVEGKARIYLNNNEAIDVADILTVEVFAEQEPEITQEEIDRETGVYEWKRKKEC